MNRCLVGVLAAWTAWAQPSLPPPSALGSRLEGPLLRVPSKFAGPDGVWVRVAPPKRPRYADGAPVVIHVPGGLGPGGVETVPQPLGDFGFVDIALLFPGGESGPRIDGKPLRSGGSYDWRGPASIRALADVILFATGRLKSTEGKTIHDYAGSIPVLTDQVGLLGWSLGGTTVAAALGMHGQEFSNVKWYASHESPYGEGVINWEFGSRFSPNRFYDPTTGRTDYSRLQYSKDLPPLRMGRPSPAAAKLRGSLYLDGDGNGTYNEESDFAFSGMFLQGPPPNIFYSPSLTRAALEKKVFGGEWPAHIATLEQTIEASGIRDGVSQIPNAVKKIPNLSVIVFAGEVDHIQGTADHRHILLQYDGWLSAGVRWARLNPDSAYTGMVLGKTSAGPQNPARARFDRVSIRQALMPEPPQGPTDMEAMAAAACELADRTRKDDWRPVLGAVLFPQAPKKPRAPQPQSGDSGKPASGRQPPIQLVFNIHYDPVGGPNPEMRIREQERRRDNMIWLQGMLESIDAAKRPKLTIQISGSHAEFFLKDEKGYEMMRRYYAGGHNLGTHFHLNIYNGSYMDWSQLRPSRPFQKPQPSPGEFFTPGSLPEPNSMEEVRRLWRDNFQFTDALVAKLAGVSDPKEVRRINNNGEFFLPQQMKGKDELFREYGITVQTGGRNELFNMIFDHDVFNAWRPGTAHDLDEDVSNRAYVCVPQLAVVGNIKPHQGVMQDLSVPAMKRRFLQILLERREHERLGLPPKAWTFGWTVHDFDMDPPDGPRRPNMSQRQNLQELVKWLNDHFVPEVAVWGTPNSVAEVFYRIEAQHPGLSHFRYPYRKRDWDAYPYRLKGLARALIGSHLERELPVAPQRRIRAFQLARVKPGSEWYTDQDNNVQVRGETSRLFLVWSESGRQTLDLSGYAKGKGRMIHGATAEATAVDLAAIPVSEAPAIIEVE